MNTDFAIGLVVYSGPQVGGGISEDCKQKSYELNSLPEQTDDERIKASTEGVLHPASDQRADSLPLPSTDQHVKHLRPL